MEPRVPTPGHPASAFLHRSSSPYPSPHINRPQQPCSTYQDQMNSLQDSGRVSDLSQGSYHSLPHLNTRDPGQSVRSPLPPHRCAGCGCDITDRFLLHALERYWHSACLRCCSCRVELGEVGSSCYTRSGMILCREDYIRLFGSAGRCSACSSPIPPNELVLRVHDNVYHVTCFSCATCRAQLVPGDKFRLINGNIICGQHYDFEGGIYKVKIGKGMNGGQNMDVVSDTGSVPQSTPLRAKHKSTRYLNAARMQQYVLGGREFDARVEQNEKEEKARMRATLNAESIQRSERIRAARMATEQQQELEMEDMITRAQHDRELRKAQEDQEERLAAELKRLKIEKVRDEKMRQQIRENSLELRELEARLKAAYTSKERQAQMAEKEAMKCLEAAREAELARMMEEEKKKAEEWERFKEREKGINGQKYQQELEQQLVDLEMKKKLDYEDRLRDKILIDECVRRVREEDERLAREEAEKRAAEKRYMEEDERRRQEYRQIQSERLLEEERKIQEYARENEEKQRQRQAQKKEEDQQKEKLRRELAAKMADEKRAIEEYEQMRQELYAEEQEQRLRDREMEEERKRIRMIAELQRGRDELLRNKALRIQQEQVEEEMYRKQMMEYMAEKDRVEQMNAQKRRMTQLDHKRAVELLIQERRDKLDKDKEREREILKEQALMAELQKKIVEEERMRLIREHAPKLMGYLPKGVIRDERDLEMLGAEFKEAYSKRTADPLSDRY